MVDAIGDLERRIRKRFGAIPSAQYEQIARDFRKLIDNGLRYGNDLPAMALDSSLDPSVRSIACWFLARLMPRRVSAPALMTLLAASPARVRAEAARSLGVTRSRRALPVLVDLALHDQEAMVRESSVEALGLLQDERGLDTLLTIAQNEEEAPALRGLAIEQIGRLGVVRPTVIQALTSLLEEEHVEVAFWAIYALGELGTGTVVPTLESVAKSESRALQPFGTLRDEAVRAVDIIRSRERLSRTPPS